MADFEGAISFVTRPHVAVAVTVEDCGGTLEGAVSVGRALGGLYARDTTGVRIFAAWHTISTISERPTHLPPPPKDDD